MPVLVGWLSNRMEEISFFKHTPLLIWWSHLSRICLARLLIFNKSMASTTLDSINLCFTEQLFLTVSLYASVWFFLLFFWILNFNYFLFTFLFNLLFYGLLWLGLNQARIINLLMLWILIRCTSQKREIKEWGSDRIFMWLN